MCIGDLAPRPERWGRPDGGLRPELERAIAELGLGSQVRLLGWQRHDEVIRLCEAAHVLVAPSFTASDGDEEGIPNAV